MEKWLMKGPNPEASFYDRILHCEEDIEGAFIALLKDATCAGWNEAEVCAALAELAEARLSDSEASRTTDEMFNRILKRRRPEDR
jgi:hypothetical protein